MELLRKPCVEERKILNSFQKIPGAELTEEEWNMLLEHYDKCEYCKRSNNQIRKLIEVLAPNVTKKVIRKRGIPKCQVPLLLDTNSTS